MSFWINNTKRDTPDVILTLVVVTVLAAVIKFLLDGVTITLAARTIDFGHMDAMSYGTLLAPILGAHGYLETKNLQPKNNKKVKVDNPDEQ